MLFNVLMAVSWIGTSVATSNRLSVIRSRNFIVTDRILVMSIGNGVFVDDVPPPLSRDCASLTMNGASSPSNAARRTLGSKSDAIHPKYFSHASLRKMSGRTKQIFCNAFKDSSRILALESRYRFEKAPRKTCVSTKSSNSSL